MVLTCNNICKSFGTDDILKNVSFNINDKEKAAIVGINGSGKTTLLKIIMGQLNQDEGEVIIAKGYSIGYLAQHQDMISENTIYNEMLSVKEDVIKLDEKIRNIEHEMKDKKGKQLDELLETYIKLNHQFEQMNGYSYKSEVIGILKGLGFEENDFNKKIDTLSGGQKTRIALGKLLLNKPDIILLDEPTNHLDMNSIAWLETFLLNYSGTVIIVAHDRYFLDKIVSKIIELDNTKATTFEGNYTMYAKKKEALREAMIRQYLNQQREIKHQEEVITKLRSFNREKSIKRAESRVKMLDKMEKVEKPVTVKSQMNIKLEPKLVSGNDVLLVKELSKSFGKNHLFSNINFEIKKGEKVAIIGNNGTGKTTILKIINNVISADEGEIKLGSKVKIGYYDQEHQVLNMEKTLFDEIQDEYPDMDNTKVRNVLASFLFTNDDVFKIIKDLSGGERGRVSLAKLMLSEANFLILDEPTNHLDITSKEILETALNNYTGTVLYVSHDRYFINKTATRILDLTNNKILNYIGNYDYYLEKKPQVEKAYLEVQKDNIKDKNKSEFINKSLFEDFTLNKQKEDIINDSKMDWQQQKKEQAKQRKKQNEIKKLEDEITMLEQKSDEIDNLLTKEEIYTDVSKLMELNNEKKYIEENLEKLMEKWEEVVADN